MTGWPTAGTALIRELESHPGRLALIRDGANAQATAEALADLMEATPFIVGRAVVADPVPVSPDELLDRLGDASVLMALDALFWKPWILLDPLMLLRKLARRRPPAIAIWPGVISGSSATYSAAGRPDSFAAVLEDAVVLRPVRAMYPDQVPYEMERW